MAWTPPKTWDFEKKVASAELNEQLRDNLNFLADTVGIDDNVAIGLPLMVHTFATSGSGTQADPWTSGTNSAGWKEAIDEAANTGRPIYARAGYYKFESGGSLSNLFSGLSILTDGPQTVLIGPNGTGALRINVEGTSTDPIENVYIQSLHILRTGAGGDYNLNISFEWAHHCHLETVTAEGGGSSVIGLRSGTRDCQFDGARGWGGVDRLVFQSGQADDSNPPERCQWGRFVLRDGVEVMDFSGAIGMQIDMILGINCSDEALDMKSCSEFEVGMVAAIGCNRALTTSDEVDNMDVRDNVLSNVVAMDCTNTSGIIGFLDGAATGTRQVGRNRIENYYCVTTATNAAGALFKTRGSAQLESIATVGRFHIETPGNCIEIDNLQTGFTLAGSGYARSSNGRAFQNSASGSQPVTELTISGPMRFAAPSDHAINLGAAGAQGTIRLGGFWIEEAGTNGIHGINFNSGVDARVIIDGVRISECGSSGIRALLTRGEVAHLSITDTWIWNTNKSPSNADRNAAIELGDTFDTGSGDFLGFNIDDNRIFDTQSTATTVAYMFIRARDYYTRRDNTVLQVSSVTNTDHSSTEGANSVVADNLESTGP